MQPTQKQTEHKYMKNLNTSTDNKSKVKQNFLLTSEEDTEQTRDVLQVEFADSNNHRKIQVADQVLSKLFRIHLSYNILLRFPLCRKSANK